MPKKRFSIETRAFVTIWRDHINHDTKNDWRTFVLACFDRFTAGKELSNHAYLLATDKQWKKWTDDKKYDFLSEKCYAKAIIICRNLANLDTPVKVDLPNGYRQRNGVKGSRTTTQDLADIFAGA